MRINCPAEVMINFMSAKQEGEFIMYIVQQAKGPRGSVGWIKLRNKDYEAI